MSQEPTTTETFNEDSLRAAIVGVWGEHGAHTDVFDYLIGLNTSQRVALEAAWVALIPVLDHAHLSCNEGMDQKCFTCTALTKIGVVTGRLG